MFEPRFDTILREIDRTDLFVRYPWIGWGIHGVEVTQGVQYYESARHLTDPADRQPDNAVTLIANKPAWVRVYVRSGWFWGDIAGVTGTITLRRRQLGFLWSTVATLTPQPPGTVTARRNPPYATERGTLGYTLNFIIPADQMCGNLRFDIRITTPSGWCADRQVHVDATLRQTLRLAGIMVGYNGPASAAAGAPNLTLAAPTLANLQTTSAWTLLVFPVRSAATYRTAGTVTWNVPLTDAPSCPGCCSPNWVALNTSVQAVRIADGNRTDVLYYGLMANGIPMGPIIGCNSGGVSTSGIGDGITMAHELGHACGRPHSPCGTPGDPLYPAYEPYDPAATPTASVGEYGLDISNGAIKSPATFKDFMSYCGPRWVSLFVYGRLTNNAALDPVRVCVDRPWWRDEILYERLLIPEKWLPDPPPDPTWLVRVSPKPVISIIGVLQGPNELEVRSVFRLEAESEVPNGRALDLRAELVNAEGRVVGSGTVYSIRSYGGGGCGCHDGTGETESYPRLVQAFVPDAEAGAILRIRGADEPLWSRAASRRRPKVSDVRAEVGKGELRLSWSVDASGEQEPEAWAQWSGDRGQTWHALGAGLKGGEAALDVGSLPSGRVAVRLLVSDGFYTAVSRSITVTVPRRPPDASILTPREGQIFVGGSPMRLWGAATTSGGEPIEDEQARWAIDGREVATGLDAFVEAPKPGEHRATFSVTTREGKVDETVSFTTVELLEERDED
ncbi:MAG: hypothetical protein ACRDGV_13705 [Candidatus Limnocylindria bacterium]